jgi:hypothetical protein
VVGPHCHPPLQAHIPIRKARSGPVANSQAQRPALGACGRPSQIASTQHAVRSPPPVPSSQYALGKYKPGACCLARCRTKGARQCALWLVKTFRLTSHFFFTKLEHQEGGQWPIPPPLAPLRPSDRAAGQLCSGELSASRGAPTGSCLSSCQLTNFPAVKWIIRIQWIIDVGAPYRAGSCTKHALRGDGISPMPCSAAMQMEHRQTRAFCVVHEAPRWQI